MAKKLSETNSKKILGVSGSNVHTGSIRSEEFLPELKGTRAIKKFREMRDNDSTIGAVMYATEQVLRDVKFKVVPSIKDDETAVKEAEFVEQVFEDMDHTLDDHISEALSFLSFGFGWFEIVYKRRIGPYERSPKKKSKYTDGRLGIRKIATRAPWTVNRFDIDRVSGDVLGIYQNSFRSGDNYIPVNKSVYYRTTSLNADPSGRSILRNAYAAYERLKFIQDYEAIGIERELAGIPVGRIPAEYLAPDASEDQLAFKQQFETILKDLKRNEQGYALLPSDLYPTGDDGKLSNNYIVDISLMSSDGTRQIDLDPVIRRYQHDIARSLISEFIMLGSNSGGSYAMSKSKTDLFLRGLESYIQTIADVLNKQVVERLWEINGLDFKYLPKIVAGDVAPHDLKELGAYLRNLNGAGIPIRDQVDIVDELFAIPELPPVDRDIYAASLEQARLTETARNDYYNGPDDDAPVVGNKDQNDEDEVG